MKRPKIQILFVCGGNTCRSPMAASLAAAALGETAEVKSAGIAAWGEPASRKTIELLRRRYGIDLSLHRSRDVEELSLKDFDCIVAMKPEYAERLLKHFGVTAERIVTWDIDDPFIEGTDEAYEKCLGEIDQLLSRFLEQIRSRHGGH